MRAPQHSESATYLARAALRMRPPGRTLRRRLLSHPGAPEQQSRLPAAETREVAGCRGLACWRRLWGAGRACVLSGTFAGGQGGAERAPQCQRWTSSGQAPPCVRTERPVGPQPPLPSTVSRATACPPQHPRDRRQWPRFAGEGTEARGGGCRSHVAGGRGAQAAVPRTAGPAGGAADEALSGALTSSPPGTPCCHHPVRLSAAPEATQARRAPALD